MAGTRDRRAVRGEWPQRRASRASRRGRRGRLLLVLARATTDCPGVNGAGAGWKTDGGASSRQAICGGSRGGCCCAARRRAPSRHRWEEARLSARSPLATSGALDYLLTSRFLLLQVIGLPVLLALSWLILLVGIRRIGVRRARWIVCPPFLNRLCNIQQCL